MELPDNFVHLRGEVLRDSEVRHTKSGSPVFNFTLAVAGYKRDKYVDCVAFDSVVDQGSSPHTRGARMAETGTPPRPGDHPRIRGEH